MNNTTTWIDRLRDDVTAFLTAFEELQGLSSQYVYLNYASTLTADDVTPPGYDINNDITVQDVLDAVATLSALKAAMDSGHGAKLYRLRK